MYIIFMLSRIFEAIDASETSLSFECDRWGNKQQQCLWFIFPDAKELLILQSSIAYYQGYGNDATKNLIVFTVVRIKSENDVLNKNLFEISLIGKR